MAKRYKVGRRDTKAMKHAFTLERLPNGGLRIADIQSLTDAERGLVLAHFGREQRTILGIGGEQHYRTLKPGTDHHFNAAVTQLPWPFMLMGGN